MGPTVIALSGQILRKAVRSPLRSGCLLLLGSHSLVLDEQSRVPSACRLTHRISAQLDHIETITLECWTEFQGKVIE